MSLAKLHGTFVGGDHGEQEQLTKSLTLSCLAPIRTAMPKQLLLCLTGAAVAIRGSLGDARSFLWVRAQTLHWVSSSLHLIFCQPTFENLRVGLRGPTWRIRYGGGSHHQSHPLPGLDPLLVLPTSVLSTPSPYSPPPQKSTLVVAITLAVRQLYTGLSWPRS